MENSTWCVVMVIGLGVSVALKGHAESFDLICASVFGAACFICSAIERISFQFEVKTTMEIEK